MLAAAALAACKPAPQAHDAPPQEVVSAAFCEARTFEGSHFTACRYDARRDTIQLAIDDPAGPLRSFARLRAHLGSGAGNVRFAMNAGMFDSAGMPIGLAIEDGRERHAISRRDGPGNFHMKPNGVFAVDERGRVAVVTADDWRAGRHARWATQSGPMLVIAGALHPQIQADGPSLHIRNGVGVADPQTAWFAISDEPVSFGRLARFFRDGLGCRDALYFDGSVSSLWDPGAGREDDGPPIGPMIVVSRASAAAAAPPR